MSRKNFIQKANKGEVPGRTESDPQNGKVKLQTKTKTATATATAVYNKSGEKKMGNGKQERKTENRS